jgi:hypothetical protein
MPVSIPYIDYIPIEKYISREWIITTYDGNEKLKITY